MTGSRRPNRGSLAAEDNRAALIAAARTVFASQGYDAPLSLIARTAGVGQGPLYRHFPDREAIALAVFAENVAAVETLAADPGSTLDEVLTILVDQLTESIGLFVIVNPDSVRDTRLGELNRRLRDLLADKLRSPDLRGRFRDDLTAADLLTGLGMLAALLAKTTESDRPAAAATGWRILSRGLWT
jgi:AcrR family transcriptional regulator